MVRTLIVLCILVSLELDRGVDVAVKNLGNMTADLSYSIYKGARSFDSSHINKTRANIERDLARLKKAVQLAAIRVEQLNNEVGFTRDMRRVSNGFNRAVYTVGNKITGANLQPNNSGRSTSSL